MKYRQELEEALNTLERVGCQFNHCPGPNKQHEDMATCFVCDQIRKTRLILANPVEPANLETPLAILEDYLMGFETDRDLQSLVYEALFAFENMTTDDFEKIRKDITAYMKGERE